MNNLRQDLLWNQSQDIQRPVSIFQRRIVHYGWFKTTGS